MKQTLLLSVLFIFSFSAVKSEKSTIIYDILNSYVIQKVEKMQELVKFSDVQANQLKKMELDYLLDIQKAENCKCCNTKKRVEKLKKNRDAKLQQILTREQYVKYDMLMDDRIKDIPPHL